MRVIDEAKTSKFGPEDGSAISRFVDSAHYTHFLWDHWYHCGIFENGVLLRYTLEGVSSVANFITAYEVSQ